MALNCGIILRECIRYEPLARAVLNDDRFFNFFQYVEMSTFDIASDAFTTFKVKCHLINKPEFFLPPPPFLLMINSDNKTIFMGQEGQRSPNKILSYMLC